MFTVDVGVMGEGTGREGTVRVKINVRMRDIGRGRGNKSNRESRSKDYVRY